jgi:hypothetical protein
VVAARQAAAVRIFFMELPFDEGDQRGGSGASGSGRS